MKINICVIALVLLNFLTINNFSIAQGTARPDKWTKLGSRLVNHGLDKDEILVKAYEEHFDAIQIRVKKSGINMHRCVVHFGDGSTQEIELKQEFKQGEQSRLINLDGTNRIIRKVVFWYDTKNYRRKKALVEVWGKNIR
ncbi:MAG: DUF2541 family protein [Saprospiraceae bacterium]|nr:DUF2541 family protein [Saprospiraceae bacterium]MBK7810720.1 DUF2541 family protein [Saprospiraceae bacterium]MBK9631511.1 DUF2541 family protein [Saprospiraceae bacterium]